MKKIIITGHPQSELEQIESLLLSAGMAAALPSQDKQLTAQEITTILCKAHGVVPLAQIQGDQTLAQIEVAPVWQGMVLDLMLANLQHPLWGWADPHSIQLLEYWKAQDPQVVFVLVYDAPHTALTRLSLEDAAAPAEVLQQRLQTWVAYNSALLQFYLRNPQRCVLVHASEAEPSAQRYVQLINSRIDAPLQLSTPVQEPQLLHPTDSAANEESAVTAAPAAPEHSIVLTQPVQNFTNSQQAHMLLAQLLETYPQAQTLYEELQAAATLPRNNPQMLGWNGDAQSRFAAWQEFVQLHQLSRASHAELLKKQEQFTQAQQALEADFSKIKALLAAEQSRKNELQVLLQQSSQKHQESTEENELLLTQLHQVQEELERHYLDGQKLKQSLEAAQAQAKQLPTVQAELKKTQETLKITQDKANELPKVQEKLKETQAALQAAQAQKAAAPSQELEEENKLLLAQLHQVQEELERHYLDGQKLKESLEAAQAQAKQLPTVQAELKKTQETLKITQGKANELPKVQEKLKETQAALQAAQAQKAAAPSQELKEENELLLLQLHQVQEELERYYLENQKLKIGSAHKPKAEARDYYGAADRIKRQLSYRLGSVMIEKSRTLGGWLSMPFALQAEAKRFHQEKAARKGGKLPPIAHYRDAHEAERVKQHLSYRLGSTLVQRSGSLGGWLSMPCALRAQVKEFQKSRC